MTNPSSASSKAVGPNGASVPGAGTSPHWTPHQVRQWDAEEATAIVAGLAALPGAMLPVLHALQDHFGYIDPAAVPLIAEALNLSRAEVHGVIGFYHDFRTAPPGRHILRLCRAEACQSMGGVALEAHLRDRLGAGPGDTTADDAVTVEAVYCLGNCACAPSVMLDGKLHGRVSPEVLDGLLDTAREKAAGEGA